MMDKKDAIEYLLYMKHDVQAGSPVDVAIDTAIEVLKQPTIEPEVLMIKSDAARSLTDEEAAIFEERLNHDAVIEPEVRHGRWIRRETVLDVECKCSVCGYKDFVPKHDNYWFRRKFCPNCGARMDGDKDEGD